MKESLFDPLRKKYVKATPEEYVRQHFIKWLNVERGYPLSLMASEYSISFNRRLFRCDIVTFNKYLKPQIVVECKAPDIKIDNEVVAQIIRYNMVLKVQTLIVTNGLKTIVFGYDSDQEKYVIKDDVDFCK